MTKPRILDGFWRLAGLAGLLASGLAQPACSGPDATATYSRDRHTLIVGRPSAALGLDPGRISDSESVEIAHQIFDTLLTYDTATGTIEPGLAVSWQVSDPGTVWTFTLREGVFFHDGTPLDADAVAFSFERQRDPNHPFHRIEGENNRFTYWASTFRNIRKVEALTPSTVRIEIDRPFAPFEANLTMVAVAIVSPSAVALRGPKFARNPVGTGPYRFREWDDDRVVLERNPNYWGNRPEMNYLVFQSIPDPRQRRIALESGAIDVAYQAPPAGLRFVELHPNLSTYDAPVGNIAYLAMNTSKKQWSDLRVRRAINHAIDRTPIIQIAYQGFAEAAVSPLPPGQGGFHRPGTTYDYDPDRARQLLAEASADGKFDPKKPIIIYAPSTPRPYVRDPELVTEIVATQLRSVGLAVETVVQPFSAHLRSIRNAEHDICLNGWVADNADPDNVLFTLFSPENAALGVARNLAFFRDDALGELLNAARASSVRGERDAYYARVQERIASQAPWVPLAHSRITVAVSADVDGVELTSTGHIDYREVSRSD